MRRFTVIAIALAPMLVAALAAAGCGENDAGSDNEPLDGPTTINTTAAPSTTAAPTSGPPTTGGPAVNLSLRITGLRLINSEESDNGVRVLLPTGVTTASVTLTGLPTPNQVISVCQARELDRRTTGATCRAPANGEAVTVALGAAASGVELVQAGVTGSGPAGNSAALDEVVIRYAASSREVSVRLPQIAAGESGGQPTFGLTPASADGAYRAALSWMTIPVFGGGPGLGKLELVQGNNVVNQAQAGADTRLSGNVPPPVGDARLRVQNVGASSLVSAKLTVLLP